MTDNSSDCEREKLYASTRQDLLTRQLSNSEKYDNAILTLSTAALGISLAFIKDIVPIADAKLMPLLIISWGLLAASIISTLFSFVSSQRAIDRQLDIAHDYYIKRKDDSLTAKNYAARATNVLNMLSGALFVFGIVSTVVFVSVNIKEANMAKQCKLPLGAPIPALQPAATTPGTRGAPIPSLQPVPAQSGAGTQTGTPSTAGGSAGGAQSGSNSTNK